MPDKKNLPAGARRLIIPASQRLRYRRQAWLSRYAGNLWYPQWPLAAVIIVLAIYDFSRSYPAIHWSELPGHLSILLNFLQSMLAVSLFFSAIGMLFRMRLAWISAVLTTAAKLLLIFFLHTVITPWAWLVINALVFLLLLRSERYFTRRSVMSATIFVAALLSLVLSYSTVGALFLSGGFSPKIHDFISALYFSVVTISTVGYGSIVPKTTEARVFTISVIFLGITVFSTAFSSILVPLIGQHLHNIIGRRRPDLPKNHIVIAGGGDLARNTYHALCSKYYKVVLVGRDWQPDVADEAEIHPHHYITGDPSRKATLEKANFHNAYAVLCLDPSDDLNAFTMLTARQIKPDIRTVVLINKLSHAKTLLGLKPDLAIELQTVMAAWMVQELLGEPPQDPLSNLLFFLSEDALAAIPPS